MMSQAGRKIILILICILSFACTPTTSLSGHGDLDNSGVDTSSETVGNSELEDELNAGVSASSSLSVVGTAYGQKSIYDPNEWTNYVIYGYPTITVQYYSTYASSGVSWQIYHKGAAFGSDRLALGEDGKPYGYAQGANLKNGDGLHSFNFPIVLVPSVHGRSQKLAVGEYEVYLVACELPSRCKVSNPISFEIRYTDRSK